MVYTIPIFVGENFMKIQTKIADTDVWKFA